MNNEEGASYLKKIMMLVFVLLLAACSSDDSESKVALNPSDAVAFEIVQYADKIAPVYAGLVPTIAYAQTQGQFDVLKERFGLGEKDFTVDMENNVVAFVVSYSGSCSIAVDSVYNDDNMLAVKLVEPQNDSCEPTQEEHTFVISTPKEAYERAQLYNGEVIKASIEAQ